MVVRRQTGFCYEAACGINIHFEQDGDCAGLVCFQNENFNYKFQLILRGKVIVLQLIKNCGKEPEILKEEVLDGGTKEFSGVLRVVAEKQQLYFEFGYDERNLKVIAEKVDGTILSVEKAGGFVGTVIGMFAICGSKDSKEKFYADFDFFRYEDTSRIWIDK